MLRNAGIAQNPTLLHDLTAATDQSDFTNLVRVRCLGVVIQALLARAQKYIGASSLDGLTLISMQTQLTQDLVSLQQRGYCNRSTVKVTSTPAQRRIGHAVAGSDQVPPAGQPIKLSPRPCEGRPQPATLALRLSGPVSAVPPDRSRSHQPPRSTAHRSTLSSPAAHLYRYSIDTPRHSRVSGLPFRLPPNHPRKPLIRPPGAP